VFPAFRPQLTRSSQDVERIKGRRRLPRLHYLIACDSRRFGGYSSSVAGEVRGLRSDVTSEPGNPLAFILFNETPLEGGETYPE
jgi:hypothetical protein